KMIAMMPVTSMLCGWVEAARRVGRYSFPHRSAQVAHWLQSPTGGLRFQASIFRVRPSVLQFCNRPARPDRHMEQPMDHTDLIQRSLAGEHRAFGQLVERYQHMMHTVCIRVLGNAQDAEEAAQD